MKELLKKYYKLSDDEKSEIEDLYLLHQLQKKVDGYKQIALTNLEEKILFDKAKICLKFSNISCKEIIERLFEMLNCVDITICDIDKLNVEELIELLSNEETDFKNTNKEQKIIIEKEYKGFYCVLLKYKEQYILICEKADGTQYVRKISKDEIITNLVIKLFKEKGNPIE